MKLSIIIPVYNAEKYLDKCLQSIVSQDFRNQNVEVILINDGSTDQSLKIAESFLEKIKNLTIVSQLNQGEAVSRNIALKISQGEYITFLDSDDYYENSCLDTAFDIIESNDLDILYLRLKQVDEKGDFIGFVNDLQNEGVVKSGMNYGRRPFPATVYRKEIIGDITFPLGILVGPDSVFNAMVQSRAKRVSFTRKAIYNYTYRTDSLSKQGKSTTALQGFFKAILEIHEFQMKNFGELPQAKKYFDEVYKIFVIIIIEDHVMPRWDRKNYKELERLLHRKKLQYILIHFSSKYPFIGKSFNSFMAYQKYLNFKSIVYRLLHSF